MLRALDNHRLIGALARRDQPLHAQQPRAERRVEQGEETRKRSLLDRPLSRERVRARRTTVRGHARRARGRSEFGARLKELARAEGLVREIEDPRRRIDGAQRGGKGAKRLGVDESALRQNEPVGERRLPARLAMRGERRSAADGIDERRYTGDARAVRDPRIDDERVQDRPGIGEPGRLQDDARERRHLAGVASAKDIMQAVNQIASKAAAQTTGGHKHDVVSDLFIEQMIEADLAEFVDDD